MRNIKPISLDKISTFTEEQKLAIMKKYNVRNAVDLEWHGYNDYGIMIFKKSQRLVEKAITWKKAQAQGEVRKQHENLERLMADPIAWGNFERLRAVKDTSNRLSNLLEAETNPEIKAQIRRVLNSISFVANEIYSSATKWYNPLSEKQVACVQKAERAIAESNLRVEL